MMKAVNYIINMTSVTNDTFTTGNSVSDRSIIFTKDMKVNILIRYINKFDSQQYLKFNQVISIGSFFSKWSCNDKFNKY